MIESTSLAPCSCVAASVYASGIPVGVWEATFHYFWKMISGLLAVARLRPRVLCHSYLAFSGDSPCWLSRSLFKVA